MNSQQDGLMNSDGEVFGFLGDFFFFFFFLNRFLVVWTKSLTGTRPSGDRA